MNSNNPYEDDLEQARRRAPFNEVRSYGPIAGQELQYRLPDTEGRYCRKDRQDRMIVGFFCLMVVLIVGSGFWWGWWF